MITFTATDVLEFAVRLEENGELFYREAAKITEDSTAKDLFSRLADEEVAHKGIFENLLSRIANFEAPEGYPGEYLAYLHNYMDGKVIFSKENQKILPAINTTVEAFDFAIQREMDAVFYYQELKAFVNKIDHATLDKIIEEERRHFAALSVAKKDYLATK
jgi:rubrerythrin